MAYISQCIPLANAQKRLSTSRAAKARGIIIMADSSSTIGHEMPVLMNIADAKMRRFESSAIRQNLMRRIADTDYCMGMDIVDERNYR